MSDILLLGDNLYLSVKSETANRAFEIRRTSVLVPSKKDFLYWPQKSTKKQGNKKLQLFTFPHTNTSKHIIQSTKHQRINLQRF